MKIDIKAIPPEGLRIDAKEPKEIFDYKAEGVEFNEPLDVSIFMSKSGNVLIVSGKIKTIVDLKCGRCLVEFKQKLENKNLSLDIDIKGLDEIDIGEDLREETLLLLPIKPLCKSDCAGVILPPRRDPSRGGKKLKILSKREITKKQDKEDPRWSGLDNLKLE